jgi:hypothetical protein
MNKTNKCEEGVMISRGTFRDFAMSALQERLSEVRKNTEGDPIMSTLMLLEFSMLIGDIEVSLFGKEENK